MTFHIITIFPHIFDSYFNEGTLKQAQKKGLIKIYIYNLRDFTDDPHRKVDDRPFGGGPGMVLMVEPIYRAIRQIKSIKIIKKVKTIFLSPQGKEFNQKLAYKLSKLNEIVFICGRYEGIDERVKKYIADEEISIGGQQPSRGELATMVIIETVSRLIPGVLGNIESIEERRLEQFLISKERKSNIRSPISSYPVYTRPGVFSLPHLLKGGKGKSKPNVKWRVPKVLLSGNHKKIEEWRKKHIN